MALIFRWLMRIALVGFALGVLGVVIVYYLASRSLPDYDGEFSLAGISADVEIVRDNANVPHVFGADDLDVYFGLGFAHAQDRLWQMIMMRRTAQGRLSETFGTRTLAIDDLLLRLDIYNLSQRSVKSQDPEVLEALNAYARGVNAWLAEVNKGALGRGAPELFLFSNELAPWTPADSIAVGKLMALQMSTHLESEVLRARTKLILSDDRLRDILPDAPGDAVADLPDYAQLFHADPADLPRYAASTWAPDALSPFKPRAFGGASNAWAVAPSRSATGSTILANDPHLGLTAPTVWYLARLELQQGGIIGGTIPGVPVILSGRSDYLGWGLTSSYLDDQDLFIEKLNPDDPEEYLTPTGYKRFEIRQKIITVKDANPRTITMRWTENGPVLPGAHYDLAAITPPGHVASLGWTVLSARDTSVGALFHMMKSQSVDEYLDAGETFIAASQNATVVSGTEIAMQTLGALPLRDMRHQTQGRMPAPGWIETNRWRGRIPYGQNPRFRDPKGGILGNTNNKFTDAPYPNHISHSWGDTQRIHRWRRLMQTREVHTRESFIEAQLDTFSYTAQSLLSLIAKDLWYSGTAAPEGTPERQRQIALLMLADWKGEMNEHMPEPLIYAAWMRTLQDRLIRDEMGPLAGEFTQLEPVFLERVFRDVDGASAWCDIIQSTQPETCTDIARIALDDALLWIGETYGRDLASLRWGDAHQARHDHAVLGEMPVLKWFVNIRQSTSGGDNTLQRGLSIGTGAEPFANVHGSGYRGVYDLADPDSSVFITATGQSGHPLSRHYDDLGELWRRGEYIPMSLDPDLARAGAVGVTRLIPN